MFPQLRAVGSGYRVWESESQASLSVCVCVCLVVCTSVYVLVFPSADLSRYAVRATYGF